MQTTATGIQESTRPTKNDRRVLLSSTVIVLGALLALQLLVALFLGLGDRDMEPAGTQGPILALDPDQVTGLSIQGPDGESIQVTKTESGWVIPSLQNLPAAEHKVTGLLAKLKGLEKGLPVATSEEARMRFKVGDRTFERKLTLEAGDAPPVILYLGDSAGFRRLFVRADGEGAIYEAELGLFDVPDKADAWSERILLHLKEEDIEELTFAGLTLERKDDGWRLTELAEGEEQDQQAIEDFVRSIANIDFVGVLGSEEEPAVSEEAHPVEVEATLKSGETVGYRISKLAEGNDYLLQVSNRPQRFALANYAAEDLTGMSRADLLKDTEEAAESPPEGPLPIDATKNEEADR